jgi:hypothetical protein
LKLLSADSIVDFGWSEEIMKYGRAGCAPVRGNGDVRNEMRWMRWETGDQMLSEGKDIKRCAGRGSHLLLAEKKVRKMGEEFKRNIANGMPSPSHLLLVRS